MDRTLLAMLIDADNVPAKHAEAQRLGLVTLQQSAHTKGFDLMHAGESIRSVVVY